MRSGFFAGLNPCALSLVVFFAFLFVYIDYHQKEKNFLGFCFIVSIFLTYYFLELGTFEGFRRLEIFETLVRIFYILLGIGAIILGLISAYDWYVLKRSNDTGKVLLKFPGVVKGSSSKGKDLFFWIKLFVIAGIIGFLAALFSSFARGSVNLSSVISLIVADHIKVKTFAYNFLYNIMSILPFIVTFCFLKSGKFLDIMNRHLSKTKTISAGIFLGLGCGLLFMFGS